MSFKYYLIDNIVTFVAVYDKIKVYNDKQW